MVLKNYMEDVVVSVYDDYTRSHLEICRCDRCRLDAIAFALTKLRGMYASSLEGEILTRVSREDRQIRADALIVVMDAVRTVTARPKH